MTKIFILKTAYDDIQQHCLSMRPCEACGLLFGFAGEGFLAHTYTADRFVPIANQAAEPLQHFVMCPQQLTKALMTAAPDILVGIVHSHPTSEAVPSTMDLRTDWHTVPSHWIISLLPHTNNPVLVHQIHSGSWQPVDWEII